MGNGKQMKKQRKRLRKRQSAMQKREQRKMRRERKLTNLKWRKISSATKEELKRISQKKNPQKRSRKPTEKRRPWPQAGSICLAEKTFGGKNPFAGRKQELSSDEEEG